MIAVLLVLKKLQVIHIVVRGTSVTSLLAPMLALEKVHRSRYGPERLHEVKEKWTTSSIFVDRPGRAVVFRTTTLQFAVDRSRVPLSFRTIQMTERNTDPTQVHHEIESESTDQAVNSAHDLDLIIQLAQTYARPQNQNFTPSLELLSSELYFPICVPLRKAALKGNLKEVYSILRVHEEILNKSSLLRMAITKGHATILHAAAGARQKKFVEKIINSMEPNDELTLLLQDINRNTSFCFAAAVGDVEIAKIMLNKYPNLNLAAIRGNHDKTPFYMAVMFGQKEMATFLYDATKNILEQDERTDLFFKSITTGLYDIALKLLNSHPELAVSRDENDETALHMLARNPNSMTTQALELVQCLWEKITLRPNAEVGVLISHPTKLLINAAKLGNSEFLALLVRSYPDLIHDLDENDLSIFHIAISHRHANIFKLIYDMGFDKELLATYVDNEDNNMLHLAAKYPELPPASIVPGAALEMQRELLMFDEVEKIMQPSLRDAKNSERQTPKELFTMTHKDLLKRGEKWMKSTATSSMLVATLIATVVFAAAFTVPGGNDQETGTPIHLDKTLFNVFVVSDAIGLSSSSISILIFLSILTSRYTEEEFRMALPLKLMFGLLTLFISVITMTITFSSAFFLFYPYRERLNWITMSTVALVFVPVTVYVGLHQSKCLVRYDDKEAIVSFRFG
ncbi:hypothetical protein ACOSP7_003150 [Xanthoceras sorbifolium]